MANILSDTKKQQVIALGQLGWTLRRIEAATGVRRETAGAYLKAAGLAVRPPGRWGHPPANPAKEVSTDPGPLAPGLADRPPWPPRPSRAPTASACAPYRELIELALARGRNAMAIWRDLVDDHGFPAQYASVRRFVVTLRGPRTPEAHPVIVTAPGEEAQVDYGDGPMVRHPGTGKYRRTRLFLFTLGYSRKSVRLLTFASSTRRWCELHEESFRRLVQLAPAARARGEGQQADALATVAEREEEEARAAVLARARVAHHRAVAVIDLGFLAGRGDDHRVRLGRPRPAQRHDEAAHAGVLSGEAVIVDEIPPDRHRVATPGEGQLDQFAVRRAGAGGGGPARPRRPRRPIGKARRERPGVGGHLFGRICRRVTPPPGRAHGQPGGL